MSIMSLDFFILFGLSVLIYYLFPKKIRWILLVIYSTIFLAFSCTETTIVYVLANIVITYISTMLMKKCHGSKWKTPILLVALLGNIGILAVLKYSNFAINNINALSHFLGNKIDLGLVRIPAPIGISFYTFISVGYILDCYWELEEPQTNLLKTALFIGYYPQLTSGPIYRYSEMKDQLYEGHDFRYKNIAFGCQRILWGIFKKLVISSRVAIIVDGIYADVNTYNGLYIWLSAALFILQLYTDFSGCMDIILGVSECYGIILPENFKTPFRSTSVQEFWQRWHITLGGWFKDYVMYSILRLKGMKKLSKWLKKYVGKKTERQITSYFAMLCVWFLIGLWHGGQWKYVIGMGIWFWTCIVLNQLLQPIYKKIIYILKIDVNSFSWKLLMSIKVFALVAIGDMFFRLGSLKETLQAIKCGFAQYNPWIFFDGSILKLGLTYADVNIILFGILSLLIVGMLQVKFNSAREWISKQLFVFRWSLWYILITVILVYGMYGPGYSAAEFIYRGF